MFESRGSSKMGNVSKDETRKRMMRAVCDLMDQGLPIGEISGILVTEFCSVDKMYVSRYFGDLAGLLMESIQFLLTEEMHSMISDDVFPVEGSFVVHPHIEKAFKLATYLSGQGVNADGLAQIAKVVSAVYARQLEERFGLRPSQALREAKFGILFIAGFLSFGNALDLGHDAMQAFFDQRLNGLNQAH